MSAHRVRSISGQVPVVWSLLICFILQMKAANGYAAPGTPGADGFEVVKFPPEALSMRPAIAAGQSAVSNPKMDSVLTEVAAASHDSTAKALALAQSASLTLAADRVQVQITTTPAAVADVTQAVQDTGGHVTKVGNGDTWMQAWIPVDALESIAARSDVYYISRPAEAILAEPEFAPAATTEGLAVINGPAWHAAGIRGSGVNIAIIDSGFQGYPTLQGTDLPAMVVVKNFVDGETDAQVNGTTPHGTACAEIIHDIAPDASLYLVKIGTPLDLEKAVTWLKTQNINIISTSLGWFNLTPGDSTGFFANIVQSARTAGIFWITAAGNERESHWGGAFIDTDSNGVHNFNGVEEVDVFGPGDGRAYLIPPGYDIWAFLRWDDWSGITQDYSLSIVRWNGSSWDIVKTSNNPQCGGAGQTPTETAPYRSSGSNAPYGIIIQRINSSRNVNLELLTLGPPRLRRGYPRGSLRSLADSPGAMTVAALDVNTPFPQESYSSEGRPTGLVARPQVAQSSPTSPGSPTSRPSAIPRRTCSAGSRRRHRTSQAQQRW